MSDIIDDKRESAADFLRRDWERLTRAQNERAAAEPADQVTMTIDVAAPADVVTVLGQPANLPRTLEPGRYVVRVTFERREG